MENLSELHAVKFENALSVGLGAFSMFCGKLSDVYMPNVEYIEIGAFYMCESVVSARYDNLSYLGELAYGECFGLKNVRFDKLQSIRTCTFLDCSSLTSVCTPNALSIESSAFMDCINLSTLVLSGVNEATELLSTYDNGPHFYNCPHPVSVFVKDLEMVDEFMAIPKWNQYVQENQVIFVPVQMQMIQVHSTDGTVERYKDTEVGREQICYAGVGDITRYYEYISDPMISASYEKCLGAVSADFNGFSGMTFGRIDVVQPYASNVHLSAQAGSQFLSVVANDCDITCIPMAGYLKCENLKYIESNRVKAIGPYGLGHGTIPF